MQPDSNVALANASDGVRNPLTNLERVVSAMANLPTSARRVPVSCW